MLPLSSTGQHTGSRAPAQDRIRSQSLSWRVNRELRVPAATPYLRSAAHTAPRVAEPSGDETREAALERRIAVDGMSKVCVWLPNRNVRYVSTTFI